MSKKPTFQLTIQIGMFPRITRYFVSPVQYYTREGAIAAGEKWLKKEGYDIFRKYIHTKKVTRGERHTAKTPKLERDLTPGNRPSANKMFWLHEKNTRKQLGQVDAKGRVLQY